MKVGVSAFLWAAFGLLAGNVLISCAKKEKATLTPPVKVTVEKVSGTLQTSEREYSGTVSSAETTNVSFAVAGTITQLAVAEGAKVSKGQLLGKVRDGEYENAYNIALAQLEEAQDGYQRLKKLHDANALPEVKWVEMQQNLKQAENAAEMAQRTLKDATLYSPVSGTVTKKFADVGQTVVPVEPIYEIVSTNDLTIDVSVSENAIGNFSVGEKATVSFDRDDLKNIEGKITQKAVVADPISRSYTVKVAISSSNGKILPGMTGNVRFEALEPDSPEVREIVLPTQAVLLNEDNRLFVWTVKNGRAERRFVEADELVANGVIVKSGLHPGDSVIVAGMQKVGTGTIVTTE